MSSVGNGNGGSAGSRSRATQTQTVTNAATAAIAQASVVFVKSLTFKIADVVANPCTSSSDNIRDKDLMAQFYVLSGVLKASSESSTVVKPYDHVSGERKGLNGSDNEAWFLLEQILTFLNRDVNDYRYHVAAIECILQHFPTIEIPAILIDSMNATTTTATTATTIESRRHKTPMCDTNSGWYQLLKVFLLHDKLENGCVLACRILAFTTDRILSVGTSAMLSTKSLEVTLPLSLFDSLHHKCTDALEQGTHLATNGLDIEFKRFVQALAKYYAALMIQEAC